MSDKAKGKAGNPKSANASSSDLEALFNRHHLLVFTGAGGVGKTTSSVLVSLLAARSGLKVALLSIDPAKRLAAALGLPVSGQLQGIFESKLRSAKSPGSLEVAMLDQKTTFDRLVARYAPSPDIERKILDNPFYKAASELVAGPLEYLAIAKVHEILVSKRYDLIVLDTPPATNSLDFLKRPRVLADFVSRKSMSLLIKPFRMFGKLQWAMPSPATKILNQLVEFAGLQSVQRLFDFVAMSEKVILGLHEVCEYVNAYFHSQRAAFLMVTNPNPAAVRETLFLRESGLRALALEPAAIFFNRTLPRGIWGEMEGRTKTQSGPPGKELSALDLLHERLLGEQAAIAAMELSPEAGSAEKSCRFFHFAETDRDLHDPDSLWLYSEELGRELGLSFR